MMNNSLGGYFEARIKRNTGKTGDKINIAFWFDSPGPDLKYYLEEGTQAFGATGIRPRGQVFEIDLCEYITTEIVLHGNVDEKGKFERNIGHHIEKGDFVDKWVTHGMLWTPAGLKFYIDGEEVYQTWDLHNIKSPNHTMNMFFGAYGIGDINMEVDYVRHYQWQLEEGNELPNSSFEYHSLLFPWEGTASIASDAHEGKQAALLAAGDSISQYIYLNHSSDYILDFWTKSQTTDQSNLLAKIENIVPVSGKTAHSTVSESTLSVNYEKNKLYFKTKEEKVDNKATVKVTFINVGNQPIVLDDIRIGR